MPNVQRWRRAIMLGEDLAKLREAGTHQEKLHCLQRISQSADLLDDPTIRELADEFLNHGYPPLRGEICYLLGLSGRSEYLPRVQACAADEDPWVREQAAGVLKRLVTLERGPKHLLRETKTEARVPREGPGQVTTYRVFIASPSDVAEERRVVSEVIEEWNSVHGRQLGIRLETLGSENAVPLRGTRPQELISRQLADQCQILIGVFWTRLGTATWIADSGTVEEIERFEDSGKPVLLYFSTCPAPLDHIDLEEVKRLREYKNRRKSKGLYQQYGSIAEFRELLRRHLSTLACSLGGAVALGSEGLE